MVSHRSVIWIDFYMQSIYAYGPCRGRGAYLEKATSSYAPIPYFTHKGCGRMDGRTDRHARSSGQQYIWLELLLCIQTDMQKDRYTYVLDLQIVCFLAKAEKAECTGLWCRASQLLHPYVNTIIMFVVNNLRL